MSDKSILLSENDVLSVKGEDNIVLTHHTYKVSELVNGIMQRIDHYKQERWCKQGVDCEVLVPNKTWQKGKVKISIEFIPDQENSPSPLDDVRKNL